MKIRYIVYIIVSLLFGVSNFILTFDFITSSGVLLLFLVFFFALYEKKRKYYKVNLSRSYEAINYINNFIISLSVNPSLNYAFENFQYVNIESIINDEFNKWDSYCNSLPLSRKEIVKSKYILLMPS